jgi:hypothetical protein
MVTGVLPGLRELRAPLAAGYVWLLAAWLALGDELPTAGDDKAPSLDRLYRLEPVVSDLGLAVVASVAAYLVGSIAIDVQARVARLLRDRAQEPRQKRQDADGRSQGIVPLFAAVGASAVIGWIIAVNHDSSLPGAAALAYVLAALFWLNTIAGRYHEMGDHRAPLERRQMNISDEGRRELLEWLKEHVLGERADSKLTTDSLDYIDRNRNLLKTRILNESAALHSEIDRPDAEATFRMAMWPALTVLVTYLVVAVSPLWTLAFVLPIVLAWQWISLRRQANDALVTSLVARDTLGAPVLAHAKTLLVRDAARTAVQRARKDVDPKVVRVKLDANDHTHAATVRTRDGTLVEVRLDEEFNVIGEPADRESDLEATRPEAAAIAGNGAPAHPAST